MSAIENYEDSAQNDNIVEIQENNSQNFSRREFLTRFGLGGTALAISACAPSVFAGSSEQGGLQPEADMLASSEATYSSTGNTWMIIPEETVFGVTGGMDNQTSQIFGESLVRYLNLVEVSAGESAFPISENLIRLGMNIDPNFGNISLASVIDAGGPSPIVELRDNGGNIIAICQTSNFGGIQICAREGSPLNIRVPSKAGPVPRIKREESKNISTGVLQLLKFGRYGANPMNSANSYLSGLGG